MSVPCVLCAPGAEHVVARSAQWRVIRADDTPGFPGFYRVIWADHVRESSDLSAAERHVCMDAVSAVETALREVLQPDKINLAALGNMVPHLHWHVIARYRWDSHFPAPIWAAAARTHTQVPEGAVARVQAALPEAERRMCALLGL